MKHYRIFFAIGLVGILLFACAACGLSGRYFPMEGSNLSELQTEEVIRRIVEITGAADDNIGMPSGNFGLHVTGDFDWYMDGTISMTFTKKVPSSTHDYGCQLRINLEGPQFYVIKPYRIEPFEHQYELRHYLDALKYLPQEEIRSLVQGQPDLYAIDIMDGEIPNNDGRPRVYYDANGRTSARDWQIMLRIQPMARDELDSGAYHGEGDDCMYLFYSASPRPEISTFTALINGLMEDGSPYSLITADPVGFERLFIDQDNLPQLDFTPSFGQTVEVALVPGSLKEDINYEPKVVTAAVKNMTPAAPAVAAQYVRTNGGSYEERWKTVVIESKQQLDDYYRVNRVESRESYSPDKYDFDYAYDDSKSFADAITKYDDTYFEENLLVFAILVESSGSYRHIVTSVDNGTINIKHITAGAGTCDLAAWHVIVEISRADCSGRPFALNIV